MNETFDCQSCGQLVEPASAYHPHLYCVLYRAGIRDQAAYLAAAGWQRIPANVGASD